jgi:hypothetical protein
VKLSFKETVGHALVVPLLASATLLFVQTASATVITPGQANIAGTVNVSSAGVFFFGGPSGTTANVFNPQAPDTGSYTGLISGNIQNLLGPPVTGAINIVDFVVFNTAAGTVHFDLTNLAPGLGTLAGCNDTVGSICTLPGSPFTLIQRAVNQVEIDLSVSGFAYFGTSASGETFTSALFTTQNLVPGTITGVLTGANSSGGITNSYSATFSSVVPEPTTTLLIGTGLLVTGVLTRRKIRS